MSDRFPGGFITKDTPVTTPTSATGVWTLDQAMQATKAGNWPTNVPFFIEDLFSTWLYTGNGSTQTITNGIDLAGKGGMVWVKSRSNAYNNTVIDTVRGMTYSNYRPLFTNLTSAQSGPFSDIMQANADGFSYGTSGTGTAINSNGATYASWTFREQPKFFDVVTYTGNGSTQTINHNLGVAPAVVIIKKTSAVSDWYYMHNMGASNCQQIYLNETSPASTSSYNSGNVFSAQPTSTSFFLGSEGDTNGSGSTMVAYLFASNAGGFGTSGNDNVISCGSVSGFGTVVNLGFEPQWILMKQSNGTSDWIIADNMRGIATGGNDALLFANTSGAETSANDWIDLTSTGFVNNVGSGTFIYIAIRRGPMAVPTTGTSVFAPNTFNATNPTLANYYAGFPIDLYMQASRAGSSINTVTRDRLRQANYLSTSNTAAEVSGTDSYFDNMYGSKFSTSTTPNTNLLAWMFRRAPGFFDEVCYTGTGSARTVAHNLAAVPEFMIVKNRVDVGENWQAYHAALGATNPIIFSLGNAAYVSSTEWNNTTPTSTVFTVGTQKRTNFSGSTYVAYLFASCPGVSKVGSYTGTGTTQTINCGFTAGSRFVMIKRTDASGGWYVWDSARGIVAGNDPYLLFNSTAAEVTNTDYIDTAATGFEITSTAPAAINASGGTFIYLAIA
jgi:hypothetical protein